MTDRYDELRVSPDPSRAEELRQRLHAELERSSLDDATAVPSASHDRSPARPVRNSRPMEEMRMSDDSADSEHKNRWRIPAVAAAAIVVARVGAIAFAVSNTNADDPDGVSQAPAPTAAPTTRGADHHRRAPHRHLHGDPRRPDHLHRAGRLGSTDERRRIRSRWGILHRELLGRRQRLRRRVRVDPARPAARPDR